MRKKKEEILPRRTRSFTEDEEEEEWGMSKVDVSAEDVLLPAWSNSMSEFALKVLDELKRDNWELSILLCNDKTITELNNRYRGKNEPTDVLTFNLGETIQNGKKTTYLPGDIVISLDTLGENSRYFQIPPDEELRRLIIHGILHLDGMEHETNNPDEPMLRVQEEILDKFGNEHIIPLGEKI
jgi:probable rRNA maturation factor